MSLDIRNMDCLMLMKEFADKHFDLAIVDPPYGLERFKANDGGNSKKIRSFGDADKNWNNIKPDKDFFEELFRVSKYQIIWGGNNFELPTSEYFIVWNKNQMMPSFAMCEYAWTNCKVPAKIFNKRSQDLNKIHPTQKPVSLYEFLLKNYAKQDNKILDTHFGSGSIAIAMDKVNKIEKMNLSLTAAEIDFEYYTEAMKRVNNLTAQTCISFNH